MGLDSPAVKFLCAAKSMGVDFTHTVMVGRQQFFSERDTLERVSAVLGIHFDPVALLGSNKFGEPFFRLLGAEEVSSIDASPFEGATHLHDLNLPLPAALSQRYSVVYDGGTLEHIFNLPLALKNCMEMVRLGGHFMQITVANNFMGHGFWQLSPELIYRVFTQENGYRVEAVLLHEVVPGGAWYAVRDPNDVHQRVELCNSVPTYILTIAKRVALTEFFVKAPQQSDYAAAWAKTREGRQAPEASPVRLFPFVKSELRQRVPKPLKRLLRKLLRLPPPKFALMRSLSEAICYRRIDEDDLLRGRITAFDQYLRPDLSK